MLAQLKATHSFHICEALRQYSHRRKPHTGPQQSADGRCQQVVDSALKHKHLDEVASPCADGAGHAHLLLAFCGQHNKDEKDEQQSGRDRERAKTNEHRGKDATKQLGHKQVELFHRLYLERVVG